MKKFAKTFLIVSGTSFLLFWITWELLMAVLPPMSQWQFFSFTPTPPPSFWQSFFMLLFEVLSMPMSIMLSVADGGTGTFVFAALSLANSLAWGLCLGFPIYAIRQRFCSHPS
jgi:hypothetical protein